MAQHITYCLRRTQWVLIFGNTGLLLVPAFSSALLARCCCHGGSIDLKKTAATILSHGMDLKDKASEFVETAKENMEDLAAEAQHERDKRKAGEAKS